MVAEDAMKRSQSTTTTEKVTQTKAIKNISQVEQQRADSVRNEGIEQMKKSQKEKEKDKNNGEEIDLEIEAPGSASQVAEEGSLTI